MNRYRLLDDYEKPPLYFDDIGTCYGTAAENDGYVSPHRRLGPDGFIIDEYADIFESGQSVRVGKRFKALCELWGENGKLIRPLGADEWMVAYDGFSDQRLKTEWLVIVEEEVNE